MSKVVTNEDIKNVKINRKLISLALRLPCKCNLNCSYCYGKIDVKGRILSYSEIRDVLKQASDLGARTVEIVGEGEPLLFPQFKELINLIDSLGMIPTLYSNCLLMTSDLADYLYEHNTTVIGKQNCLSIEKQDEICGVTGAYQQIITGLNHLIEAGFTNTKPSRLAIHTVVLKDNLLDISEMWRQWRKRNILPQVQSLVYPSKTQEKQYFEYYKHHTLTPIEIRKLFEELSKIDKEEFGINWDPILAYPIAPDGCRVIYGTIGITQNGNIQICSYTEKPIDNIRKTTLKAVLEKDEVKRIRNMGAILDYPNHGYGCRANTYNITGDRFAPDSFYDEYIRKENGV